LNGLAASLDLAQNESVDLIVHSGDLYDRKRPEQQVIAEARALLGAAARHVPVLVIAGNHDVGTMSTLAELPGVIALDEPRALTLCGTRIAALPFERDRATWAAQAAELVPGCDVAITHQSFHGARVPGFTFRDTRDDTLGLAHMPPGDELMLCGHIHVAQRVALGSRSILHCGSTARTSAGEGPDAKVALVIDLGSTPSWHLLPLPERDFVHVRSYQDLRDVAPGALVHLAREHDAALTDAVLAAGGWFAVRRPRRSPSARDQLGLFAGDNTLHPSEKRDKTD